MKASARTSRREKLGRLGLDLPLLPTSTVGSFPKPEALQAARTKVARKEMGRQELEALEREATATWVRTQEEIGLDVLVDGEMYRGDMVAYFAEVIPGFQPGGLVRSYGNRYYHKPVIVGEVRWPGPITVAWWRFAQSLTAKPVKGMLTGPYTIMDWAFNEYYPNRRAACLALAKEVRKEVEALVEAGAKIIQVDEPALSARPEEIGLAVEAMRVVTEGLPTYFIIHACYGAFEAIYPDLLDLAVDNFDLAISNSALDLLGIFAAHPFTKDLSLGVLDVHSHKVETAEVVRERITRGLQVMAPEALWIDPDCGLKTRTADEARRKLAVMVQTVREARETVLGAH